ncbi:MAG TPA: hypothetical protein DCZ94_04125 [Lentisphaeria bacterium]|nr:MAG: hypothetical protein A2X48_05345 [Lentisphaerae bacterium GWF2_49_21]HBC86123.1 hypothetical protein [Lentisphaeria bacterium]
MDKQKIVSRKRIASGKWLFLEEVAYIGHDGVRRTWDCSMRRRGAAGAVAIVALLRPSMRLVLVRQFRPPVGGYVIEFPAGLVDKDEKPVATAKRELYEETGYFGKIMDVSRPIYSSPGMTGESVRIVRMEVDERTARNRRPRTAFDDGEHIETFLVPLKGLGAFLEKAYGKGDLLDAKVVSFAKGMQLAKEFG